jgi:CDP-glycerol glycerophosphotransferase
MKYLSFILLYLVSIPLRFLIKIDNNLLLFSARGGLGYEGNAKYLFLFANRNTKFDCVWISKSRKIVDEISNEGYRVLYYFSWEALYLSLRARAVFITHSLFDVMPVLYQRKTLVIDLWHGVPIKRISFLDKNLGLKSRFMDTLKSRRINYMISNSSEFEFIYSKSFKIPNSKIKNFGLPKIEFLRKPEFFKSKIKNYFLNEKKIILYAPTFRDYKFINPFFDSKFLGWVNNELEKTNGILYIKLHPEEENPKIGSLKNVKILDSQIDIYTLLPFVDNLISDYSSVFLDFISAFPNKRVSLFIPDFEEYKSNRNFNFNFCERFKGIICAEKKELFVSKKQINEDLVNFINPINSSCQQIINLL